MMSEVNPRVKELLKHLEEAQKKLLDLTLRNPLLNYKPRKRALRIVDELPDFVFDRLVTQQKEMEFRPDDSQDEEEQQELKLGYELPPAPKKAEKVQKKHDDRFLQTTLNEERLSMQLKRMSAAARTAIEETGSNILYLAIGFLEWFESNDSSEAIRSPLILVPIEFERVRMKRGEAKIVVKYSGEDLESNLCLAEKLGSDFGVELPTAFEGDKEETPERYFKLVQESVAHKKNWRVVREICLGFFSFSRLFMYRDLDPKNWPAGKNLLDHLTLQQLLLGKGSNGSDGTLSFGEPMNIDEDEHASEIPLILPADSSQHTAMVEVLRGKNVIVEGPPGTGKSQTIANLIAALLWQGKKVLFVSEKLAALEVVKRRLDGAGLGWFVLELHSHQLKKRKFLDELEKRLKLRCENSDGYTQAKATYRKTRDRLNEHVHLMHKEWAGTGKTIYEIVGHYEKLKSQSIKPYSIKKVSEITPDRLAEINEQVATLGALYDEHKGALPECLSFGCRSLSTLTFEDSISRLEELMTNLESLLQLLNQAASAFSGEAGGNFDAVKQVACSQTAPLIQPPQSILKGIVGLGLSNNLKDTLYEYEGILRNERASEKILLASLNSLDSFAAVDQEALTKTTEMLQSLGLSAETLDNLLCIKSAASTALELYAKLLGELSPELGLTPPTSAESLSSLEKFLSLADTSIIDRDYCEEFVSTKSKAAVKTARGEAEVIAEEEKNLQRVFNGEKLPPRGDVEDIATIYRKYEGRPLVRVFHSEFRSAQTRIRRFIKDPHSKFQTVKEWLDRLVALGSAKDRFSKNEGYKRVFGEEFRGVDTDWNRLSAASEKIWQLFEYVPTETSGNLLRIHLHKTVREFKKLSELISPTLTSLKVGIAQLPKALQPAGKWNLSTWSTILSQYVVAIDDLVKKVAPIFKEAQVISADTLKMAQQELGNLKTLRSLREKKANSIPEVARRQVSQELDESCDNIRANIDWAVSLLLSGIHLHHIRWMLESDCTERLQTLFKWYTEVHSQWTELERICTDLGSYRLSLMGVRLESLADSSLGISASLNDLKGVIKKKDYLLGWAEFGRVAFEVEESGLSPLVKDLLEGKLSSKELLPAWQFSYYTSLLKDVLAKEPSLEKFLRASHERTRQEFLSTSSRSLSRSRADRAEW